MSARSCTATRAQLTRTTERFGAFTAESKHTRTNSVRVSGAVSRRFSQEVEWRSVVTVSEVSHRWCEVSQNIDRTTAAIMSRRGAGGIPTNKETRQRVRRTTTHQQASTSWRSAALSSWTQQHTGVPTWTHSAPVLIFLNLTSTRTRHKSQTHEM